jgi:hypothetical protein
MNLNRFEKGFIIAVFVLVLLAIVCNFNSMKNPINEKNLHEQIFIESVYPESMTDMPKNIKELSKKYNAFKEIYFSDELILVYGYESLSIDEESNGEFHKSINKLLKNKNINVKVLAYDNWNELITKVQQDNGKDTEACKMYTKDEKDLQKIVETTRDCLINTCLIDAKNSKYAVISKNPEKIIMTIEKQLGKQH